MTYIRSIGVELPYATNVSDLISEEHLAEFSGWPRVRRADASIHASELALSAARKALDNAGIGPDEIGLVVSCGVSRDYAPSWSLASRIAQLLSLANCRLTFDVGAGCAGLMVGLNTIRGELNRLREDNQFALILCAEKWNHTIDYENFADRGLWGHSDAGAALIVSASSYGSVAHLGPPKFVANPDFSELIVVERGGTRENENGEEVRKGRRVDPSVSKRSVAERYEEKYLEVARILMKSHRPKWAILNQTAPNFLIRIAAKLEYEESHLIRTGYLHGHAGSADLALGMKVMLDEVASSSRDTALLICSSPYLFGGAILSVLDR